jgi:hypothetical protein
MTDVDGTGDVSCPLTLRRSGSINTFTTGSGIINNQADYNAVCALSGRIHMVNQINYCGGTISSSIIGCSDTPGSCMILVRTDDDLEGILWMHEYGHNKGLDHRNVSSAVMHRIIDFDHKRVNSSECSAYQAVNVNRFMRGTPQPGSTRRQTKDITVFVHQLFIHGVPYEEASSYPSSAVPALLKMLDDPKEERYWSNIVITLGAIGDPRAVKPLLQFFRRGTGQLSTAHFNAKTAVLLSLGYLSNKSGNRESFNFLERGLSAEGLVSGIKWTSPFPMTEEELNTQLTNLAIWGLALSGRPEAGQVLRSLRKPAVTLVERNFESRFGETIDEALGTHAKVARSGLVNYYKQRIE